jgi:uncharacterized protein (TIGR03083 family)
MAVKSDVHRELEKAWAELCAVVDHVPPEDREKPGVVDGWTLKDLLGHIAFWSGRAAETLRCACDDRLDAVPVGEGESWVDEWNAREYELRRDRPFTEIRIEWLRNYQDANACLDATPEDKLNVSLREQEIAVYFAGDTYLHFREHVEHIRDWLRRLETSEE